MFKFWVLGIFIFLTKIRTVHKLNQIYVWFDRASRTKKHKIYLWKFAQGLKALMTSL